MKKTILMLAIAFGGTTAFAQDLTSKKGEPYLPEAGDWAIGFDAAPFLQYAGNLFNGATATNGSPGVNYVANLPWSINGKMFKDEKTAYIGMLRIGMTSTTIRNLVADQLNTSTTPAYVTDSWKHSTNNIVLGGGLEMRRGKTRLQGYYGGMVWIAMMGSKDAYEYGNAITATYMTPVTTDFTTMTSGPAASRVTSAKAGSGFGFGLRGFIGAEYFILPKISIAAEYGWGVGMMNTKDGESVSEAWDGVSASVVSTTTPTGGDKWFGLDTDLGMNMSGNGSIKIIFHF